MSRLGGNRRAMRRCRRWDSNPQGLAPRDVPDLRFTGFATPAPHRLRTTAIHTAETRDLMHATVPRVHYGVRMSTSDNLVLAGGVGFLRTVLARSYEGM